MYRFGLDVVPFDVDEIRIRKISNNMVQLKNKRKQLNYKIKKKRTIKNSLFNRITGKKAKTMENLLVLNAELVNLNNELFAIEKEMMMGLEISDGPLTKEEHDLNNLINSFGSKRRSKRRSKKKYYK